LFTGFSLLIFLVQPCLAFDTGHHADMTRNALYLAGFSNDGTDIIVVDNWITDYYSALPETILGVPAINDEVRFIKRHTSLLHFDNLSNNEKIDKYWRRLIANTRAAIKLKADKKPDIPALQAILGMTLHAVQDFYSHSNWVDRYGGPANQPFETKTWLDVARAGKALEKELHTGLYEFKGKRDKGVFEDHSKLNQDSYSQPDWERAYVFAYAATRQWVQEFRGWVNEVRIPFGDPFDALWNQIKNHRCGADLIGLVEDVVASYQLSKWIDDPRKPTTGHWKGDGSMNLPLGLEASDKWSSVKPSEQSEQRKEFTLKATYLLLTEGLSDAALEGPDAPPLPTAPIAAPFTEKAVIVTTTEIQGLGSIQALKMFAKLNLKFISGSTFSQDMTEATENTLGTASDEIMWQSILFVPVNVPNINIQYDLFNERDFETDTVDITSFSDNSTGLKFTYSFGSRMCAGDVVGRFDSPSSLFLATGNPTSRSRGSVKFFVTEAALR